MAGLQSGHAQWVLMDVRNRGAAIDTYDNTEELLASQMYRHCAGPGYLEKLGGLQLLLSKIAQQLKADWELDSADDGGDGNPPQGYEEDES